ncbi:unnamed protein product [Trifolium pratense]|uniref:Uncharacterized protein n=1 Tax=Trifolium pratense TaxID=57577 RepID=A0ACB0KPT3_TRIPR|nr:unnamed protein product [Trifolium pratense]
MENAMDMDLNSPAKEVKQGTESRTTNEDGLREFTWQEIRTLSASISGPWCLAGDFNIVLYEREKIGGAPINNRSVASFASCLSDCNLFYLGFAGHPFTFHRGNLHERLDRVVCNSAWQQMFPSSSNVHLPLSSSDHCGLWFRPQPDTTRCRKNNYFKFLGSWLDHPDFDNQVRNSWYISSDWRDNMNRTSTNLKSWNKQVVGNIFKRKERILRRLEGINRALHDGPNDCLIHLKADLWEEYRQITQQEENYWFQQARSKWITLGESTLVRRRQNKIVALQENYDSWIYDEDTLKQHVVEFYNSLYTSQGLNNSSFTTISTFPVIREGDFEHIGSILDIIFKETSMMKRNKPKMDCFALHVAFLCFFNFSSVSVLAVCDVLQSFPRPVVRAESLVSSSIMRDPLCCVFPFLSLRSFSYMQ